MAISNEWLLSNFKTAFFVKSSDMYRKVTPQALLQGIRSLKYTIWKALIQLKYLYLLLIKRNKGSNN